MGITKALPGNRSFGEITARQWISDISRRAEYLHKVRQLVIITSLRV